MLTDPNKTFLHKWFFGVKNTRKVLESHFSARDDYVGGDVKDLFHQSMVEARKAAEACIAALLMPSPPTATGSSACFQAWSVTLVARRSLMAQRMTL